jgi:hypothetical protein
VARPFILHATGRFPIAEKDKGTTAWCACEPQVRRTCSAPTRTPRFDGHEECTADGAHVEMRVGWSGRRLRHAGNLYETRAIVRTTLSTQARPFRLSYVPYDTSEIEKKNDDLNLRNLLRLKERTSFSPSQGPVTRVRVDLSTEPTCCPLLWKGRQNHGYWHQSIRPQPINDPDTKKKESRQRGGFFFFFFLIQFILPEYMSTTKPGHNYEPLQYTRIFNKGRYETGWNTKSRIVR